VSTPAPAHGGDLAWANARFGTPKRGWLDLSTGINPVPYPMMDVAHDIWRRLPQADAMQALTDAAASCYGVKDPAAIVAANGSQAILQWLPRLMPRDCVAIVTPTYGEYAACWRAAGHDLMPVRDLGETAPAGVVVLANPNNPDGRRFATDELLRLADALVARGGMLVVDEAFADAEPDVSLAPHAGRDGLVVLRSFGTFFGLGGLRLGFALAPPSLAQILREAIGPWAVSGPAATIGARALSDRAWIAWTQDRLKRDSAGLALLLQRSGLTIVGRTAQFCLAAHDRAAGLFDHLGRRGILTRAFADQPSWLRFGLPAPEDFSRLDTALGEWTAAR
jgi:cobalamin biosynthetic protein CobC